MARRALVLTAWLGVIAAAAWLRFHDLALRPVHADEATGARLLAKRMETGVPQFDPVHFHGPLQSILAEPLCLLRGETSWEALTAGTLRTVPALAGILLCALPLSGRRRWGDAPMLLAAALLAVAPPLVYYSRMFIHEMPLACAGMLALLAFALYPRHGVPGVFLGLMFAAKESVLISLIAWGCAAVALAAWHWRALPPGWWRRHRADAGWSALAFLIVSSVIYSDGFHRMNGVVDAWRSFFVYQTGAGHDEPLRYYLMPLVVPLKAGGVWWFGTPVVVLALVALGRSVVSRNMDRGTRLMVQFSALGAAAHIAGYSLISYKTPWLMVFPWAQICLVAGFAVADWKPDARRGWTAALAAAVVFTLVTQYRQARFATGRFASDARNPYLSVPTLRDIGRATAWLHELARTAPGGTVAPVAVVGRDYWPLPWYLRGLGPVGYWPQAPDRLERFPVVFVMPEAEGAATADLARSHRALPRGLRDNVAVTLYLRNDLWQAWSAAGHPP